MINNFFGKQMTTRTGELRFVITTNVLSKHQKVDRLQDCLYKSTNFYGS